MRKWLRLIGVLALVLVVDQLAKAWIIAHLDVGQSIELIPALSPYLQITRSSNTGIAFGMFTGSNAVFLVLSSIIVGVLLTIYRRSRADALLQHVALAMIMGGALGNVIDRLRFGHVVDFVHVVIPGLISNVSNFADHAIVLGVALLIVDSYLHEREEKSEYTEPVAVEARD